LTGFFEKTKAFQPYGLKPIPKVKKGADM